MKIVSISDILKGFAPKHIEIIVSGWIRTRRDSKANISFLNLYDGSCLNSLQVVVDRNLYNYENEILHLTSGCSVTIIGKIVESIGKKQDIELIATTLKVLGWVEQPSTYPIAAKNHTMKYLRNIAHLRPRTHIIGSISRIRHTLFQAIHDFMSKKGFLWIPTPIITASDTEGNSKMFCISTKLNNKKNLHYSHNPNTSQIKSSFFGKESYLTVSGQLNIEAYACSLSKVYTFGPTFRAEHSDTNRHLAEFWMLEPEAAFLNLNDIIILSEVLLKDLVKTLLTKSFDDIEYCSNHSKINLIKRLENFTNSKFNCIKYTEIIDLLKSSDKSFDNPIHWGLDLFSEHEKYLLEEYFKSPIIIINHPKDIKAFYMRLNDDNSTVSSMDVLIPGIGEIIGGSQREERLSILDKQFLDKNLSIEHYWWYRDLRRYGTVPHSGFGLGFERLLSYVTGIHNVKDVSPFPRTFKNITF